MHKAHALGTIRKADIFFEQDRTEWRRCIADGDPYSIEAIESERRDQYAYLMDAARSLGDPVVEAMEGRIEVHSRWASHVQRNGPGLDWDDVATKRLIRDCCRADRALEDAYVRAYVTDDESNDEGEQRALDGSDFRILQALNENGQRLLFIADIAAAAELGNKLVGQRLNGLIDDGLALRPNGERSGAEITAKGRRRLNDALKTH